MRRVSISALIANLAALALLGLTGAAFAGPIGIGGFIGGLSDSTVSLSGAFIDTLSSFPGSVFGNSSSGLFYPIYATILTLLPSLSGSSSAFSSSLELIGYVLSSLISAVSSGGSSVVPITGVTSAVGFSNASLFFSPTSTLGVPEPNSIAILVSGVAGLAALAGRRRARRLAKNPPVE